MKKRTLLSAAVAAVLSFGNAATADVVEGTLTDDGWVTSVNDGGGYGNNNVVQDGGTGERLKAWIPNPPGAWQYNRHAFFTFDVSAVDLNDVVGGTVTIKTHSDVASGAGNEGTVRLYQVDDLGGLDDFDETSVTWDYLTSNSIAFDGNALASDVIAGVVVDEAVVGSPAANAVLSFDLSSAALAELANDTNGVLTFVAQYRQSTNGSYGGNTGPSFYSKEAVANGVPDAVQASLQLESIPEPGTASLLTVAGLVTIFGRRRRSGEQ